MNLANVNTPGFQASRVQFSDWLNPQQKGAALPGEPRIAYTQDRATWRDAQPGAHGVRERQRRPELVGETIAQPALTAAIRGAAPHAAARFDRERFASAMLEGYRAALA